MKSFISLILILLCINVPSFSQFVKEVEYPTNRVERILLQDLTETYIYIDSTDLEIKITDASHQIIKSIKAPCDGALAVRYARNDFENIGLGLLCTCTNFPSREVYLIDQEGDIIQRFKSLPSLDNKYIIDYDANNSQIYNTQSLELVFELPGFRLSPGSEATEGNYYCAHNALDSIFIYDENLSRIKGIGFDFLDDQNEISILMANVVENDIASFYFLVEETSSGSSTSIYNKLIDENGFTLQEFENVQWPDNYKFHKHNNCLQVPVATYLPISRLSSYFIKQRQYITLASDQEAQYKVLQNGKYLGVEYNLFTTQVNFYNYTGEVGFSIELDDQKLFGIPTPFLDHLGNEYIRYFQANNEDNFKNNTVLYKDGEYLQTLTNSGFITVLNSNNLATKILLDNPESNPTSIYGLASSNTSELPESNLTSIQIFPNPVSKTLIISDPDLIYNRFTIADENGKIMRQGIISNPNEIDVSYLHPGVYFLRVYNNNNHKEGIEKFVKI